MLTDNEMFKYYNTYEHPHSPAPPPTPHLYTKSAHLPCDSSHHIHQVGIVALVTEQPSVGTDTRHNHRHWAQTLGAEFRIFQNPISRLGALFVQLT